MQFTAYVFFACVVSITLACRGFLFSKNQILERAVFNIRADVEHETIFTTSTGTYYQYDISILKKNKWITTTESVDETTLMTPVSVCRLSAGARYTLAGTFRDINGDGTREMYLGLCKIVEKET